MSFCPIDEAFGNYLTNDLETPNPIESSLYKNLESNNCEKKSKLKNKKINCNRQNTSFTMNPDDLYQSNHQKELKLQAY